MNLGYGVIESIQADYENGLSMDIITKKYNVKPMRIYQQANRKGWDKNKRKENKGSYPQTKTLIMPNIEKKEHVEKYTQEEYIKEERTEEEEEVNKHPIFSNKEELDTVLYYVEHLILTGQYKEVMFSNVKNRYPEYNFTNKTIDRLISLARSKMVNDFFLDKRYLIIEHIKKLDSIYTRALKEKDDRMAFLCLQERGKVLNLQLTTDENANIESYLENKIKTFQIANEKFDDISIKDIE